MRHAASPLSIALCAAPLKGVAVRVFAAQLGGGDPPEWLLLVPKGRIITNDSRTFSNNDPDKVVAASRPDLPLHIDFDHGTQLRDDSRAAAWVVALSAKGPAGEEGVWGRLEWTPPGIQALADKVYRFFSPTMIYGDDGVVTKVIGGGLVNNPAIDELPALASTQQENTLDLEEILNEHREALGLQEEATVADMLALLGLTDTATAEEVLAAIAERTSEEVATAAAQLRSIATAAGITLAAGTKLTDSHVTAICAKLKKAKPATGGGDVAVLRSEVTDLTARLNEALSTLSGQTAEQKVSDAIEAGKIVPALKANYIAICKADPAGFDALVAKAPVIVKGGKLVTDQVPDGELDAEQLAICKQAGVSAADFKKSLKTGKQEVK